MCTHREAPRAEHAHEVHAHGRPCLTEEHAGADRKHHAHRPPPRRPPRRPSVALASPCNARVAGERNAGAVRSARQPPRSPRGAVRGHRRLSVRFGAGPRHHPAVRSFPFRPPKTLPQISPDTPLDALDASVPCSRQKIARLPCGKLPQACFSVPEIVSELQISAVALCGPPMKFVLPGAGSRGRELQGL